MAVSERVAETDGNEKVSPLQRLKIWLRGGLAREETPGWLEQQAARMAPQKQWLKSQFARMKPPPGKTPYASLSYRYLARQIAADLSHVQGGRIVILGSPLPREINNEAMLMLAYFMADELGGRVLLVDGTLRHGGVGTALGQECGPGMLDIMYSETHLKDVIRPTGRRGVFLVPAGTLTRSSSLPLVAHRMGEFFAEARREFDYILVQQTSIFDDTRYLPFAGEADLTLILVEEGGTLVEVLEKSMAVFRDHEITNVQVVLTTPE